LTVRGRKWSVVFLVVVLLVASGIVANHSAADIRGREQRQPGVSPGASPDTEQGDLSGAQIPESQAPGAQGQVAPQPAPAYDYTAPDFGENRASYPFLVLRTLAVLAVLVIIVYLVFRVFLRNRHKIVTSTDVIKVLATYPLAGSKSIQIVQIAEKVLILGITDSNINLIATLEDKEAIDKIKLESSKESRGFQSFKDHLLKLISGKAFSGQGQISYFNEFKQRIKNMKKP
jgi:flagellar biosynthetic protein FliO